MPTDGEISDAGAHIKRAARDLDQASRADSWDEARDKIRDAAEELRRAGSDLDS